MKRLLIAVMVIALLVMSLPSLAVAITTGTVDTEAVVGGSGSAPYVCAKFETPDDYPLTPGTQIEPTPGGDRTVKFYVVTGDPNGVNDIAAVYIKLYHPDGTFKYQLDAIRPSWTEIPYTGMIDMNGDCSGDTAVATALDSLQAQGRITYGFDPVRGCMMDLEKLKYDLSHGKQIMIELVGLLNYHQMAGMYKAQAITVDMGGKSCILENYFEYISIVALLIDFTEINWGTVNVNQWNILYGDEDLSTPTKPTIRNIGNDPSMLSFKATDMLGEVFFKKISRFDVKMLNGYIEFDANVETLLTDPATMDPVLLPPCTPTQIDFSVHPPSGTPEDDYEGSMCITILHYVDS